MQTFYSTEGLTYWPGANGGVTTVMNNGTVERITCQPIKFTRVGASNFFSYNAHTPEEIESLERRVAEVGDVFGPEEFNRRLMPDAQKISAMEERIRELEQKNSLLESLKAQGKIPLK